MNIPLKCPACGARAEGTLMAVVTDQIVTCNECGTRYDYVTDLVVDETVSSTLGKNPKPL